MAEAGVIEWGYRRPPSTVVGLEQIMTTDTFSRGMEQLEPLRRMKSLPP